MAFSMAWLAAQVEGKTGDDRARGLLAAFRGELYRCFATYRDALLELAETVLVPYGPPAIVRVRFEADVPTEATLAISPLTLPFPEFVGELDS